MAKHTIEWIGTGSAFNPELGNTSFLVRGEGERVLLVDCGALTGYKLIELGCIVEVTDLLVTHCHADHAGGIETLAFFRQMVMGKDGPDRLRLHVVSDEFAQHLWNHCLSAGMGRQFDKTGAEIDATLETYFQVHTGKTVSIPGLPTVTFFPQSHVPAMENYGLDFDNGVHYSGDSNELPPHDAKLIFQDCQFVAGDGYQPHVTYEALKAAMPPEVRAKTHLVHLSPGYEQVYDPEDGFGGTVMPGDTFEV